VGSNEVGREGATWLVKANQRTQYYRGHTSQMHKALAAYIQPQSPMKPTGGVHMKTHDL
jgi:hypothetical protein